MSSLTATQQHTYNIDEAHSTVRFWVRHMMIAKVHGELADVTGSVAYNPDAPGDASIEATINTASLTTGQDQRDAHLKSPDFLNVESFPTIKFKSKAVKKTGAEDFEITGDLTLHGTTREVVLTAEVSPEVKGHFGGYKIGVSAATTLNREDFGMTWNQALEAGGVLVGKEIHLQIDVELDRPEA